MAPKNASRSSFARIAARFAEPPPPGPFARIAALFANPPPPAPAPRPLSAREAIRAREIAEMARLLDTAGYDPVHAERLSAEGMGPFELEDRLKHAPGTVGSLPYTHGIEPRKKPALPLPADVSPPPVPSPPAAPALTNTTFPGPVTLYFQGDLGMAYRKLEARDVNIFFRPYAQYSAAARVRFTPKGARTQRELMLTYKPKLIILAGHGHPDPKGMWTDAKPSGDGVTTQMSRHMAFSEEWESEARDMIEAYATRTGARVLADFHGYNAHRRLTTEEQAAWDAVRGDEQRGAYR